MRIAQVSPLYERVPPLLYGGTERIVAYLTDALLEMGHDVTLFASGDSDTAARLIPCCKRSLRLDKECVDPLPHHLRMLEQVVRLAGDFDVIHFHIDCIHYSLSRWLDLPGITTLHGRLDIADLVPLYREFNDIPVVSISDAQRSPLSWINWQGTIHHGLPAGLLPFSARGGDYLAFVGRVSPEKGLDSAIAIARESGVKLMIAAKIDQKDAAYFESVIKPTLNDPLIEFVGEIGEHEKKDFLGRALALLFPICWEEPFGLVMIESMACGTPVIAFNRGSVPEIVQEGVSGFIVGDVAEGVSAVQKVGALSRKACRAYFEQRFNSRRMAEEYVRLYTKVMQGKGREAVKVVATGGYPGFHPERHGEKLVVSGREVS